MLSALVFEIDLCFTQACLFSSMKEFLKGALMHYYARKILSMVV